MPIRSSSSSTGGQSRIRNLATISTLPTIKAMKDCFETYLTLTISSGNASADTIRSYRNRVNLFLSWCKEKELYPALVKQKNILEYRKQLIDSQKKVPTISLSLVAIKHFYTACLAEKLVKDNPVVGVKPPKEKRQVGSTIGYLTEEELQQLFDSVTPTLRFRGKTAEQLQILRDRILLGCMAFQGCRGIELYRANWGDLTKDDGDYYLKLDGKNSIRTALLRPDLAQQLVLYGKARTNIGQKPKSNSPLVISLDSKNFGGRLSRNGMIQVCNRYLKKCGLKEKNGKSISAHSLRHTAATLSLRGGSDLREVQDFLGHDDPKTTAIYTHVLNSQENNPANRIGATF